MDSFEKQCPQCLIVVHTARVFCDCGHEFECVELKPAKNDFKEDLSFSMASSDETFWDAVYKKAFPDMIAQIPSSEKSQSQRLGIDRLIHLSSGKTISIDEKKRRQNWNDILLEYHSNSNNTVEDGWMNKDLLIDYLAYAFMEDKIVYLFNWLSLRRVWIENKEEWHKKAVAQKDKFKIVTARNRYYDTKSIAVPIDILLTAMNETQIIQI